MHVSVSYASILVNRSGRTRSREHFTPAAEPIIENDHLTWGSPRLGVNATLQRGTLECRETLIDGVEWRCVMPSATALFEFDGEPPISGRGYAELLEMRIAPWKLPIGELRWGRFAGAKTAVTWIDWRGERPLTTVLVDGVRAEDGTVADDVITAAGLVLTVGRDRVIRDEPIGARLRSVRRLLPGLPSRIVDAHETKWCGRATASGARISDSGWAVHEIVRFA